MTSLLEAEARIVIMWGNVYMHQGDSFEQCRNVFFFVLSNEHLEVKFLWHTTFLDIVLSIQPLHSILTFMSR